VPVVAPRRENTRPIAPMRPAPAEEPSAPVPAAGSPIVTMSRPVGAVRTGDAPAAQPRNVPAGAASLPPRTPAAPSRSLPPLPPGVAATPAAAVAEAAPAPAPARAVPAPASAVVAGDSSSGAGAGFDEIFDQIQGLVVETLQTSVDESFQAARAAEGQLRETRPSTAAAPAVRQKFGAPADDESDDADEPDVPPAAPFDWGVKKAPKPQGAWLVEDDAKAGAAPKRPANGHAPDRAGPAVPMSRTESVVPEDVAPAAAPAAPAAAAGGRGYLVRKLGDEVQKLQPAVEALKRKGLVTDADLGAEAQPRTTSQTGDDMVSVESFADRKPVDLEAELSPTRLVEELRRLRRLTDALVAKGVLSEQDLSRAASE
jgi:hypothetical protein